ncbi:uncharacterized protein ARMOST_20766 [Armillaria ostoyae]|uniref:Uncharacterized protein n=1 Tax=Armillaria ostoyae TaxID=47428 RepID=A0A284S8C6_ARMOS|nr:uncharacterized protein ARMOST_20766 [Armillaria ostoyae]
MPSKFHDITPIVVSEGNDDFFRVSSAVATTATEIPPPHATMGTVVTVLFVVSSQLTDPLSFSTDANLLHGFKCRGDILFDNITIKGCTTYHSYRRHFNRPSDGGNYGTTGSSNCVHHLSGVRGRLWPAVVVATELVRPTRFHNNGDPPWCFNHTRYFCFAHNPIDMRWGHRLYGPRPRAVAAMFDELPCQDSLTNDELSWAASGQ